MSKLSFVTAVLLGAITASAQAEAPAKIGSPKPVLRFTGTEKYSAGGKNWVRYHYDVVNKKAYPSALFAPAPDLPPCGTNPKAARTWVDLYDKDGGRLYGFCALGSLTDLSKIWFAKEEGTMPPSGVYMIMTDRKTNTSYRSNVANTKIIAAAAPANHGQSVRAQDPQSLVNALQAAGYSAKLGVDKIGDPMITSAVGGSEFQIGFYNCTDHKQCATVTFHSGYDLKTDVSLDSINEWNRAQRFGRAYLDKENDPILEMDVDLDDGGVAPLLFIDNIEFWASVLGKFETHIGYRK